MKTISQKFARSLVRTATVNWKEYSRLILYGDNSGWVLDWERRELQKICKKLDIRVVNSVWKNAFKPQSIFFFNHFFLETDNWLSLYPHRIGFAYFHGLPNKGFESFDHIYNQVKKHHEKIARVQVTHSEMRDSVLSTGIDPSKVFQIPIGINLDLFPFNASERKQDARKEFNIPESAFVIGSIQKDGIGWAVS